ncbi:MAG: hydroxyacylglutathione hydrolase [Spirulina sp.]
MQVIRIPVLSNNYIFLLHDDTQKIAAVVDPALAPPVLQQLNALNAKLVAIFNTHHHWDHIGGNQELLHHFPELRVYGGREDRGRLPGQQVFLKDGDRVEFGDRIGEVFFVPGHTIAHIAYYFPAPQAGEPGELFCGDTLFAGGCGRLFEGTPAQMVHSLGKLRNLPDNTRIWCAHEYTLNNLKFALTVDSGNPDLQARYAEVRAKRSHQEPTIPSAIGIEKRTNPFLRCHTKELQEAMGTKDEVKTFACLRGKKDLF